MSRKRPELSPIRFGTDGWRALIASEFTFSNVERVAQAYADYILRQRDEEAAARDEEIRRPPATRHDADSRQHSSQETPAYKRRPPAVVVGYDRRFLSEQFALRAAEVFAGNQFGVSMFEGDMPTPLVSWAVREQGASGGVVITASHNPPLFNGFKIKAPFGGSATPEMTVAVESLVDETPPRRGQLSTGAQNEALASSVESYRAQIAAYVDLERLRATPARVVDDPMHGTGGVF